MNVTDLTIQADSLLQSIRDGNIRVLARCISLIENETYGYLKLLESLEDDGSTPVIGITGPPGSGKSTLVDGLVAQWVQQDKKVAVLCVDPSSPFHLGALLGDRIRMSDWYNHPRVFIRSLATRGSLGGLHPKIVEISDLLKAAQFDFIIIETVGVGQSEVEISALADTTVVVFVPEAGDDIQTMKAGLIEIADIFVVNKCDRPDADLFIKHLQSIFDFNIINAHKQPVIIKTIASEKKGLPELAEKILQHQRNINTIQKIELLTEKVYRLIVQKRMHDISKNELAEKIQKAMQTAGFNLYQFVKRNF